MYVMEQKGYKVRRMQGSKHMTEREREDGGMEGWRERGRTFNQIHQ